MANDLGDFEQFMKQRETAAGAYVSGDFTPLENLTAHNSDATFYAPRGGFVHGTQEVLSTYEQDSKVFAPGSTNAFEILQMGASDGIAYWVGFQRASVNMQGQDQPVPFDLRVTEIFRREGDEWKLVHRHADQLVSEAAPPKK